MFRVPEGVELSEIIEKLTDSFSVALRLNTEVFLTVAVEEESIVVKVALLLTLAEKVVLVAVNELLLSVVPEIEPSVMEKVASLSILPETVVLVAENEPELYILPEIVEFAEIREPEFTRSAA